MASLPIWSCNVMYMFTSWVLTSYLVETNLPILAAAVVNIGDNLIIGSLFDYSLTDINSFAITINHINSINSQIYSINITSDALLHLLLLTMVVATGFWFLPYGFSALFHVSQRSRWAALDSTSGAEIKTGQKAFMRNGSSRAAPLVDQWINGCSLYGHSRQIMV